MRNPYFNSEGYPDPTAYQAQQNINAETDKRVNELIKILKTVIAEHGFILLNRIELKDKTTRRRFE